MTFWVYIFRCADSSYYTGHTDNLEKRIGEHITGAIASCYTFKRRPLELVSRKIVQPERKPLLASGRLKAGAARRKKP